MAYKFFCRSRRLLLLFTTLLFCSTVFGQVSITGVQCVAAGLPYQYTIKGEWKENESIRVCVEGGVLLETGTTCVDKQNITAVQVRWNDGINSGKITVNSDGGNISFNVGIIQPMNAGNIEAADKQTFGFNKYTPSLSCTPASGGSCSPSYKYQWEQSSDKLKWTAITGATGQNLSLKVPLKQTTFFRRKVLESKSQTVGYSNEFIVYVTPEQQINKTNN